MTTDPSPVALVTGAGSGMGRSTADAYLTRGWTVVAVDLQPVEVTSTAGRLVPVVADVSDRAAVDAVLAKTLPGLGTTVQAVVNVAGIYPPSTLETATPELFRRVFDVNVLGVINVMAAAVPYMSPGSAIVNFASIDGFAVSPGQFVYGASKAAVIMLTKAAALELAPRGTGSTPSHQGGSPLRGRRRRTGSPKRSRRSRSAAWPSRRRSPSGCGSSPARVRPTT
jgi:3-oxoacyl-[acyl-carrier protein] reductase